MVLEKINQVGDIKQIPPEEYDTLAEEIRHFLVEKISRSGGHLASNLGVVELTMALHLCFDFPKDKVVWDVGHQSYTHKLLTGRREGFEKLRKYGGISGFPKPSESEADAFIAGHASNSVSVALGMTRARTRLGGDYDVVAVIGDGALTGGLAYEGLSNAGQSGEPLVVILNDNAMSIGSNVGGMARLLSRMRVKPGYFAFKRWYRSTVGQVKPVYDIAHRVKEGVKGAILPENMFDDLGFYYLGPIDGHDVAALESAIAWARDMRVPVLLHVITQKGRGCSFAEADPEKYHGVGPFDPVTGAIKKGAESFSAAVGAALCREAERDERVAALTAAMAEGTGLARFARRFPERFFDTGIAEGHTVSMAAGMAKQGMLPVACVYSSFLQRGFDMLIHDVALLHLHVVFGVDRAGLVGEDGETHHGVFDIAYLGAVPSMTVWCPASLREAADMLHQALYGETGPVALRYPRGGEGEYTDGGADAFKVLREGTDVTIAAYGTMINEAVKAAESLAAEGVSAKVVKLGRVLPLDAEPVLAAARETGRLVVAEEVCASGCIGGRILASAGGEAGFKCRLLNLGEGIVGQGGADKLRSLAGVDAAGIAAAAKELMA